MKKHSPGFLAIVEDAKSRVQETNVAEISERMKNCNDSFILIDVREDREWNDGHLPNAVHIGKGVIERDLEKTIGNKSVELVLYCGGGFRSALAADNVQKMGYENVWSMDGGFRGWKEAGLEIIIP